MADRMHLRVDDYQIDAQLTPHTHHINAHVVVKFTALETLNIASVELHNDLRVTKVTDGSGKVLPAEIESRKTSTIRVSLPAALDKDATGTLIFDYNGELSSGDDGPVAGLDLAKVDDDTSYLLYAGRWFPVNAYGINRFTATMNVTVPVYMIAVGSGAETVSETTGSKKTDTPAGKTFKFVWNKPSFPGTIIAGAFQESKSDGLSRRRSPWYFKPVHQNLATLYLETAL